MARTFGETDGTKESSNGSRIEITSDWSRVGQINRTATSYPWKSYVYELSLATAQRSFLFHVIAKQGEMANRYISWSTTSACCACGRTVHENCFCIVQGCWPATTTASAAWGSAKTAWRCARARGIASWRFGTRATLGVVLLNSVTMLQTAWMLRDCAKYLCLCLWFHRVSRNLQDLRQRSCWRGGDWCVRNEMMMMTTADSCHSILVYLFLWTV